MRLKTTLPQFNCALCDICPTECEVSVCRDACQDGGTFCVARDNEGYYGDPRMDALAVSGAGAACPPAFDCNGLDPHQFADWGGPNDGIF